MIYAIIFIVVLLVVFWSVIMYLLKTTPKDIIMFEKAFIAQDQLCRALNIIEGYDDNKQFSKQEILNILQKNNCRN